MPSLSVSSPLVELEHKTARDGRLDGRKEKFKLEYSVQLRILFPFCFLPTPTGSILEGFNKYFHTGQPV